MNYKPALLALVLVSSTLAGCTGDPDGGGNDEIDSDALQNLFDEHFEDFINNTTITVNNHYHNNTTVVNNDYNTNNEFNNTTNVDGGEINTYNQFNGSGDISGTVVQAFRVVWDLEERIERTDLGSRDVVIEGTVQIPGWSGSELSYQYNGNLIKLSFTCEEIVNSYFLMNNDDWGDWVFGEYGGSQNQAEQIGYSIYYDIQDVFYSDAVRDLCWDGGSSEPSRNTYSSHYYDVDIESHFTTVVEISLSAGQAIDFIHYPEWHSMTVNCDDGYSFSHADYDYSSNIPPLLGGQADCTVRLNAEIKTAYTYLATPVSNGSGPSIQTPEWHSYAGTGDWYVFTLTDTTYPGSNVSYYANYWPRSDTPTDFIVYFTMHFVQVYEHDLE
jgi:hypothetical protein